MLSRLSDKKYRVKRHENCPQSPAEWMSLLDRFVYWFSWWARDRLLTLLKVGCKISAFLGRRRIIAWSLLDRLGRWALKHNEKRAKERWRECMLKKFKV
jgi:hypothetical protein